LVTGKLCHHKSGLGGAGVLGGEQLLVVSTRPCVTASVVTNGSSVVVIGFTGVPPHPAARAATAPVASIEIEVVRMIHLLE
jgi:hypothetical protein